MSKIFLSYASEDRYFAELARLKLQESEIDVWVDRQLKAGDDWQQEIDRGILESSAVLLVLSPASSESHYVTYEWASAIGRGKPIIPVLIGECDIHPRIGSVHYTNFSGQTLPWEELSARILEVLESDESPLAKLESIGDKAETGGNAAENRAREQIMAYLNQHGFQMVSYERISNKIVPGATDEFLDGVLKNNSRLFRRAILRGKKTGLAKI